MSFLKIKGIKQHDITDCGAACIAAIAGFYNLKLPLIAIREVCGSNSQGTSIKGILDGCEALGLSGKAMKSSERNVEDLRYSDTPAILHFEKESGLHFVVLCGTDKDDFIIMDPAIGCRSRMSADELSKYWSGYLVFVSVGINFNPGNKTTSILEHIIPLIARYKKELRRSCIAALLYIAIAISISAILQYVIDTIIPRGDMSSVARLAIILGCIFVMSLFFGWSRIKNALNAGFGIDNSLISNYISHLFELPLSFFSLRGSGELNSRISDAMTIRSFITDGLVSILISVLTLVISFALMFTYYWKLALFTLMFLPVYILLFLIANKVNKRVNREIIESSALFEEKTVEGISAIQAIKYNCCEEKITGLIRRQYIKFSTNLYKGGRYNATFALSTDTVSKAITLFLLTVGSMFIFKDELTVGELMSFYSMTAFFSTPLSELVGINNTFSEAKISAKRLFEIMDYEGEDYSGQSLSSIDNSIVRFNHISFGYPGCLPLFNDFSAEIVPGQITAITGKSGCGKSTIAAMLMRSYKPSAGTITIGSNDISSIDLRQWRNFVAIVPQDSILMNATILDNITGWSEKPDLEKVATLLNQLGMAEFISSLPCGLLTKIGERGAILSGGQRQRIAMARALYKNPEIIILDEATSSLDAESERCILAKIKELKEDGRTIIMITHKQDNINIADRIIEIGAHQQGETCCP